MEYRAFLGLLLFGFGASASPGQQLLVQSDPIPGVRVLGPTSPEFAGLVVTVLPSARDRDMLRPILRYSFIVETGGSRKIQSMTVRYEIDPGRGVNPVIVQFSEPLLSKTELITPSGTLSLMKAPSGIKSERALRHLPKLANAVSVRAGVDGVVFEDGEFVGPNLTHVFEYYVAANSQFRETMQELRMLKTQTDATVIAKLRVIARTPPERLQGLRSITLRRSMAKLLENVLQNSGRGEFEKVLSSLAPPEPNVWKQQR